MSCDGKTKLPLVFMLISEHTCLSNLFVNASIQVSHSKILISFKTTKLSMYVAFFPVQADSSDVVAINTKS